MEINRKKYLSCQIRCCTICPTFGSVAVKNIIHSFNNLRIVWVVNIVEYFIVDVGVAVMLEKS